MYDWIWLKLTWIPWVFAFMPDLTILKNTFFVVCWQRHVRRRTKFLLLGSNIETSTGSALNVSTSSSTSKAFDRPMTARMKIGTSPLVWTLFRILLSTLRCWATSLLHMVFTHQPVTSYIVLLCFSCDKPVQLSICDICKKSIPAGAFFEKLPSYEAFVAWHINRSTSNCIRYSCRTSPARPDHHLHLNLSPRCHAKPKQAFGQGYDPKDLWTGCPEHSPKGPKQSYHRIVQAPKT